MSLTTERFELQTRLAAGNAGLVYRGIEKSTRRRVALKLLIETGLPFPLDGPALLRDMARVRRTAGNNIAQLLDAIADEDVGVVLVYEYADGQNWNDAAKERRLDGAQAVDIAAQLLSAIAVGEAIRVPHGELKPMNLVLGELPGGRLFVWVLDWGLTRYRPELPPDALLWQSPERLAGAPASSADDLFSMGACLCWLLTGTVPVAGETREQLTAAWRAFPANALAQVRPDLPAKFTRWVGTLLDANPKNRFANVAEARQALAALDPPAPPVLPEIFRPRPKSPQSAVSGPVARLVAVPRVVHVPMPRVAAAVEETAPEIPEEQALPAEPEAAAEEVVEFAEETGEQNPGIDVASEAEPSPDAERAAELAWEDGPLPETAPEPELAEPANESGLGLAVEAAPEVEPAIGRRSSWLWWALLALLAVVAGAWYFFPRAGGDAGVGGGTATGGAPEVVLRRDLAARSTYCPDGKGGTWWCAFQLTHFPPTGQPGVYELQVNPFNETAIDDVIRLTFTESAGRISVVSFPARGSATLPGPSNQPQRILICCKAVPAGPGIFNVELDLWANPNPAQLGPPAFSASASKVALPPRLGVLFQKKPTAVGTTTRLENVRLGRTPQEALP